jgi:biopolymer transport protein ExbB
MDMDRLSSMASSSGGILYLMAVMLVIALTVIFERNWYLRRATRHGERIIAKLRGTATLDAATLASLCAQSGHQPHGIVLEVALDHADLPDRTAFVERLEEEILLQVPNIDARLWVVDTVITAAPLLGLLGTIIGMFQTFHALGEGGSGPKAAVTGGVAEALVATACGLFIALVGLVAYNDLNTRVRLVVHQLETLKTMLANRLLPTGRTAQIDTVAVPYFRLSPVRKGH